MIEFIRGIRTPLSTTSIASRSSTADHHGAVTASRVVYFDLLTMPAPPEIRTGLQHSYLLG
jgi:hypothetical protein